MHACLLFERDREAHPFPQIFAFFNFFVLFFRLVFRKKKSKTKTKKSMPLNSIGLWSLISNIKLLFKISHIREEEEKEKKTKKNQEGTKKKGKISLLFNRGKSPGRRSARTTASTLGTCAPSCRASTARTRRRRRACT